jgi:hypothetical protein
MKMGVAAKRAPVPTVNEAPAIGLLRRAPIAPGRIRQIAVPQAARTLSTFSHVDYQDAFLVETDAVPDRTSEQWARALLENVPTITRNVISTAWFALRLQLDSTPSNQFLLGWEVRRSTPDVALLGCSSRLGLSAEMLFVRQQDALLYASFLQLHTPIARAVWGALSPLHRQTARSIFRQAFSTGLKQTS